MGRNEYGHQGGWGYMWSSGWVGIHVVTRVVADTWSSGWVGIHVVTRVGGDRCGHQGGWG